MPPFDSLALRKFVAPEFIFGQGARHLTGRYARNFGAQRVLLVSDPGVVNSGWTSEVMSSLGNEGLTYSLFTSISSNPRSEEVMEGAAVYAGEDCDAIVVVGGG